MQPPRNRPVVRRCVRATLLTALVHALIGASLVALAEAPPGMPPGPVRYTEAREQEVQRTLTLPGTVASRTASTVASEVAGLVVALPVREGDRVTTGQVLARLRTSSLDLRLQSVAGGLKEATARLEQAERQLQRAAELRASGVMSQSQHDEAHSERIMAEGRVDSLSAERKRIELDLLHSTIRAPFAGAVLARRTEVGQWIELGGPVLEMAAIGDIEVRVDVPERWYGGLRAGSNAAVRFEASPGATLLGKVSAIVPRAEPQARTFPVKVRIPNPDGRIGVGMLAQVTLPTGDRERATIVPRDAVVGAGGDQHVYLINGDNTVERVPVTTGAGHGDWVAVEGALKAGQKIVTRGNERLMPGMAVVGEPLDYPPPPAGVGS